MPNGRQGEHPRADVRGWLLDASVWPRDQGFHWAGPLERFAVSLLHGGRAIHENDVGLLGPIRNGFFLPLDLARTQ